MIHIYKYIIAAVLFVLATSTPAFSDPLDLPRRISQVPGTTNSVPHIQIDVRTDTALSQQLLRQVEKIQGVEIGATVISMHGTKGFFVNGNVPIMRPTRIVGGREFAHMHPDGSLHASLSNEHALEAVKKGWATYHPWSTERPGWEGFVMIYTPQSSGELEVILQLVKASYDFVTGKRQSG